MNRDPFEEILFQADATARPPRVRPGLGARVRRRARRQRAIRMTSTALLAGVAALAVWAAPVAELLKLRSRSGDSTTLTARHPLPSDPPPAPVDVAGIRAQLARLEAQASGHSDLAERLRRAEQSVRSLRRANGALARPDAVAEIARRQDRAAFMLVRGADRRMADAGADRAAVERSYRQVIDLFPKTQGAAVARERLGRM